MGRGRSLVLASLLIGVGVVLLLQQADVIGRDIRIWPLVLIAIGALLFLDRVISRGRPGSGFVLPLVLVAVGLAFFLQDLGAFGDEELLVPLIVIGVGAALVFEALPWRAGSRGEEVRRVGLAGAERARVEIRHGAGQLTVGSHVGGDDLLVGRFRGGADVDERREGDRLEVRVQTGVRRWAFPAGHGATVDWSVTLSRRPSLELDVRTGASDSRLELTDLRLEHVSLETGASRTVVSLPSRGRPTVRVRGGAASIRLVVPSRMAALVRVRGGLHDVAVDERRFPRDPSGSYRSPDFDEATDRVEIDAEVGAAGFEVV